MYGLGASAADYDNDGRTDVYITAVDGDHLFHNEGNGKFRDVTKRAGIKQRTLRYQFRLVRLRSRRQGQSFDRGQLCAVDREGRFCDALSMEPRSRTARPRHTTGSRPSCIRNLGNGRFEDVQPARRRGDPTSKSLGIAVLDYNNDGWPDPVVANGTQPTSFIATTKTAHLQMRR